MKILNETTSKFNLYQSHRTLAPLTRVSTRNRCPICNRPDWCSVTRDGALAFCMRVADGSFKTARNGAFIHRLNSAAPQSNTRWQPPAPQTSARASIDHIDAVMGSLLDDHLTLSDAHVEALLKRGLSRAEISRRRFRSLPPRDQTSSIAKALSRFDLRGVPGFYKSGSDWQMVSYGAGIFIPAPDVHGRIQGMIVRRDGVTGSGKYIWFSSNPERYPNGTSSGAPVTYARVDKIRQTGEATLTEGSLKGQIASYLTDSGVIALAATSFPAGFTTALKNNLPELRTIYVAFDMDWQKTDHVRSALFRLIGELEKARYRVRVRTWPKDFKGFDDFLVAEIQRGEVAA
jgi:hypothetical protein